ncbi:Uncharacterised protein [Vibrio cholerae]|nr:Uncharacterised protein [Vibrio cholerae]CSA42163.1 Uncharacterised protein [Vibrio cholerae]
MIWVICRSLNSRTEEKLCLKLCTDSIIISALMFCSLLSLLATSKR